MTEKEKTQICEIILSRKQQDGSSGGPPISKKVLNQFPSLSGSDIKLCVCLVDYIGIWSVKTKLFTTLF